MATDYRQIRIDKLEDLRKQGTNGYAYRFDVTHSVAEVLEGFETLAGAGTEVSLAGRVMRNRRQGRAGFAHVQDRTGAVQVYLREDEIGPDAYGVYRKVDIGDILGLRGTLFVTRTGERTLKVRSFELLAKSLRPLPEKWHGLRDVEARSRMRYVDLIMNPESRAIFERRGRLVTALRRFLDERGYLEVETPVLQPLYGGAFAHPFKARYEALDADFYLRISDELYLKRLIVGGLERVYEISKDFRNEGMDRTHNPEFTMLECYQAYADYHDMLELCQAMVASAIHQATGDHRVEFEGETLDFSPPWARLRYTDALSEALGQDVLTMDGAGLHAVCHERDLSVDPGASWGKLLDELFSVLVEPRLIQPTFVLDYPQELSPLAKTHRENARLVERFEPFAGGMELGNAFSEQNDPQEQKAQFDYQASLREAGDREAHMVDDDYVRALEYGMPPTGGLGIGVDRLAMLLSGQRNIRDVVLFPHLRPETRGAGERASEDPA